MPQTRYFCVAILFLLFSASEVRATGHPVNRALLIGNERYASEVFPDLRTSVRDVRAVAEILIRSYGFDRKNVTILENADRREMLKGFFRLSRDAQPEDRVLVYYAGHGESGRGNSSWWIPVGAEQNYDYISAQEIELRMKLIPARNSLLIVDSCFGGQLFSRQFTEREIKSGPNDADTGSGLGSIQVISSGGDEPVSDGGPRWGGHSVFAYHLIAQLQANERDVLTASELGKALRLFVKQDTKELGKEQTPRLVTLNNLGQAGETFRFLKQTASSGSRRTKVVLAFLANEGGGSESSNLRSTEKLFRELSVIFQRNGLQIVNLPFVVSAKGLEITLMPKLSRYGASHAILVKVSVTIQKQQTRIWRALVSADSHAQVFYLENGKLGAGDLYRFRSQKLPVDDWEESAVYRNKQIADISEKLKRSYRETDFAVFLRQTLQ